MTNLKQRPLNLQRLVLGTGVHQPAKLDNGAAGQGSACLLEAAAWMAGERWTDSPECVSPVLGAYGRALNDRLPQDRRQELVPFIPRLLDTAGDGQDEARSLLALDWLIRVYTPAWLRLVPALAADADALAGMPPIVDMESAAAVGDMVRDAARKAAAAGAAAWAAAGAAAGDAAWAAARAAAWDAARAAAWDAAGAAAWDAAGAAAWAAARAAARDAARAAARDVLQPTVDELQTSAIALFNRMINPAVTA